MKYTFTLEDTQNGQVADREYDYDYEHEGQMVWAWTEGNMGCDCNRRIQMYGYTDDYPCNSGANEVLVLKVTDSGGKVMKVGDDWNGR